MNYDVKRDVDEALTGLRIALRASSEHLIERSAWKLVAALEKAEKFAAVVVDASLEARADAAFDAWEHANRAAFPYEAIHVDRNAPTTRKIWQAVVRAVDASRPTAPEPERTPETVLRAMLAAYEAAALEAEVAYRRTCPDASAAVAPCERAEHLGFWCERLRGETASVMAWGGTPHLMSEIAADYRARLAGKRPLNAPPLESRSERAGQSPTRKLSTSSPRSLASGWPGAW